LLQDTLGIKLRSMNPEYRRDIRILFGDANSGMRNLYRQALGGAGFTDLREFTSMTGFADLLAVARPDVILMDAGLPEGDTCAAVHSLRHGKLGTNPFLPIIITTWDAEQAIVRRAADAGADDLLVKPLNTRTLVERIEALATARKPFVVTADYIGPDRRKAADRGGSSIPLIEVPNTLRAKLLGDPVEPEAVQQALAAAQDQVRTQRLRQSAFRIAFVAKQVVPAYRKGMVDEQMRRLLADLIDSVQEIARRVMDTEMMHVSTICDPLLLTARQIAAGSRLLGTTAEGKKQLDLLHTLSEAVLVFFNPDKHAGLLADEVANAVERYRSRMAAQAARAQQAATETPAPST
jgi:DNA-binding response OmpR family regulator